MDPTTTLPYSLRQLQYALAVAEEGAFGKAAERCHVAQPSLSAQVAKLEHLWGVSLFQRGPDGARLTREGEALLPRIRKLVEDAALLQRRALDAANPDQVRLRIGVIPTVAPYLLARAVRVLRQQVPELVAHWIEAQTAEVEAMLERGDIDAGIIADPPRQPRLESAVIGKDGFLLLVPDREDRRAPASLAELRADEVLLLGEGHCLRDHALSLCVQHGADTSPFWATSLPTLVQMVGEGLGVTLLPRIAQEMELARARVRALPLIEPAARTLRLVWPAGAGPEPLMQRIRTALAGIVVA